MLSLTGNFILSTGMPGSVMLIVKLGILLVAGLDGLDGLNSSMLTVSSFVVISSSL